MRLVALVNHPDSLESYVQMVGRAGRDGEPLAASQPGTMAELGAVRGLGPAKLERYGEELLSTISEDR